MPDCGLLVRGAEKKQILAYQASKRGGYLYCEMREDGSINISGKASLVAIADIVAEL